MNSLQLDRNVGIIRLALVVVALFFFVFSFVHAQFTDVSLGTSPEFPEENADVTATLTAFSFDLNRAKISWRLNGSLQKSGSGEKTFSFRAGKWGKRSTVEATVEAPDGTFISRTAIIVPQEVNVLWQAHSYTPPFYRGAALPASQGAVIVTAFPELINQSGTRLSPQNLVYSWEQDGVALGSLSGFGKRSIVVGAKPVERSNTSISVLVSSSDGSIRGRGLTAIRTEEPKTLLYEKSPLRGIRYEKALSGSYDLQAEELVIRAEPYFFSLDDIAKNALRFRWSLNNTQVSEGRSELVVRKDAGKRGISKILANTLNTNKVLQEAAATLNINLDAQ